MPEKLHTHYEVTVEVLAPLHIGNGNEMLRDIDYVTYRDRTWVVNQEALLERTLDAEGEFDDRLLGRPISELIQPSDFESGQLFRYVMSGTPTNRPLRSQIKNVYGEPYLPGSTLKGLLRTVFIWGLYSARKQAPNLQQLGNSRSWAGQSIEREVMGANPNEDLFRVVHVTDSAAVGLDRLRVMPISIYPTGQRNQGAGVIVDAEVVREQTIFSARMSIEESGFNESPIAERGQRSPAQVLNWQGRRRELDRIAQFGRAFGGQRLADEIEYYQRRQGPQNVLNFYAKLVATHETLSKNQFLAQIGWGTGWNSKTLNNLLTADKWQFAALVKQYRLTRFSETYTAEKPFPAGRHLVLQRGEPVRPTGWVLVTLD